LPTIEGGDIGGALFVTLAQGLDERVVVEGVNKTRVLGDICVQELFERLMKVVASKAQLGGDFLDAGGAGNGER
jgi:hypothetical protein